MDKIVVFCTCTLIMFNGQNGFGVIQFEIPLDKDYGMMRK